MIWVVYDVTGDIIGKFDDLYEAEILAESVGGHIESR